MSSRVDWSVQRLQMLALKGLATDELLEHLVSCLGDELSPLTFMAGLRGAFDVPLFRLRDQAEGWVGLNRPGCDLSTAEAVKSLKPFVSSYLARL